MAAAIAIQRYWDELACPFAGDSYGDILLFSYSLRRSEVLAFEPWLRVFEFFYHGGLREAWLVAMIEWVSEWARGMLKFCTLQLARTENLRNTEQHRGNTIPTTSDLEFAKPLVLSDIDYQIIDYRLSIIDYRL
jgi:hypothetical protein